MHTHALSTFDNRVTFTFHLLISRSVNAERLSCTMHYMSTHREIEKVTDYPLHDYNMKVYFCYRPNSNRIMRELANLEVK